MTSRLSRTLETPGKPYVDRVSAFVAEALHSFRGSLLSPRNHSSKFRVYRTATEMDARVSIVVSLIEQNFHRDLKINALSNAVDLSACHLTHLFKAALGMSPTKYLKLIRMQRAHDLLDNSFLSIKEIGMKVGISDTSHFVRDFKKAYGLSPAQYRRTYACSEKLAELKLRKLGLTLNSKSSSRIKTSRQFQDLGNN